MAAQHARAVQLRRKEFGDEINYNLALCIALHMGNDGKPARLAISTLAEHGFCHYNTADKRLKEMAGHGLIKMSKSGKLFMYSIPGEYQDEETGPAVPDHSDEIEQINGRLDSLESDVKMLVKMVDNLHIIVTSSSHELHMNFTPPVNENMKEEEKKRSSKKNIYKKNGHHPHFEPPASAEPFPEHAEKRQEMVSAISGEVKTTFAIGVNSDEFEQIADGFIARGLEPDDIRGFYPNYWKEHGHYKGKPALRSLLQEMDNYINQETEKPTSWMDDIVLDYREGAP